MAAAALMPASLPPVPADVPLSPAELATLKASLEAAARNQGALFGPPAVGTLLRLVSEVERGRRQRRGRPLREPKLSRAR